LPTLNLSFTAGSPIVNVLVRVSRYREEALKAQSLPIPDWVTARLLVDTGASTTCVDPAVLAPLNIQPSGAVNIHTPTTGADAHACYQFDVQLYIRGQAAQQPLYFPLMPVLATSLVSQGIDGLLGRDVLQHCLLVYNPSLGIFTLSY